MPEYELSYFNARGLAEPIRLLLSHVGADWQETRIPGGPGTPLPDDIKSRCTFGQVPLLEFNGQKLNQSLTTMRYLGRKYDLAGKDDFESAQIDQIGDASVDIMTAFRPLIFEKDESKKSKMLKTSVENVKSKYLSKLNSLAEKNGGGYLAIDTLTWADITIAHAIDNMQRIFNIQLLDDLPALKKHNETIFNAKGIKEWVATRPETPFKKKLFYKVFAN